MYSVFRPMLLSAAVCNPGCKPSEFESPIHTRIGPRYRNEHSARRAALRHLGQVRDSESNRILADYHGYAETAHN